jgi:hypothetical protein
MSSVNLLDNGISIDQALVLASILKVHAILKSLCGNNGDETELDMSGKNISAAEATMLAAEVAGNGAISSLDLSSNKIGGYNKFYRDNGNGSGYGPYTATPEGPNVIADAIKDMRAISSVNLLKNDIGVKQARALMIILKEHLTLKSLCGNKGGETELDMSGKMKGAGDAIMLAAEIIDNGALSSLNLAENSLGELVLPAGWKKTAYEAEWIHSDRSKVTDNPGKPEGSIAIATAIPDMRALTSLNLSSNSLSGGYGDCDMSGNILNPPA